MGLGCIGGRSSDVLLYSQKALPRSEQTSRADHRRGEGISWTSEFMRVALPEQSWIDLEPARYGSRVLAYLTDFVIRWTAAALLVIFIFFIIGQLIGSHTGIVRSMVESVQSVSQSANAVIYLLSALTILFFAVEWSYPIFFEVRYDGLTPGKRIFGIRVVDENGLPISLAASVTRTTLIVLDAIPGCGLVALISMMLNERGQRIGDLIAKTMVVHDTSDSRRRKKALVEENHQSDIVLPLEHFNLLRSYLDRSGELTGDAKLEMHRFLIELLVSDGALEVDADSLTSDDQLRAVLLRARPKKHSAAKGSFDRGFNWDAVRGELTAAKEALEKLESNQRPDAQSLLRTTEIFQTLCQRYAYLSTFYADTLEAKQASQLVRYGRRLIYGRRLAALQRSGLTYGERIAASFAEVRPYCFLAALFMASGAALTALLVTIDPQMGWYFVTEETARDLAQGKLWTDNMTRLSPLASSQIMTNNISVTFSAFALGITGVGTAVLLLFNGAELGGMFAALTNYHLAHRLLQFILAHGFLELSIIAVAAGCGLSLGDALIHPGFRTRKDALQQRAKKAGDIMILSALCLIPTGIVEGYVSPDADIPTAAKLVLGVSIASCYWSFLLNGRISFPGWRKSKPHREKPTTI